MGRFNSDRESRGGYGSGRRSREGRPNFRDRDSSSFDRGRRRLDVHEVICDKCGKECDVPFKPTGNKPVLCRDCFRKNGSSSGSDSRSNFSSRDNSSSGSNSGISQQQYNELNSKLDKILGILEMIEFEDEEEGDEESEDDSEEDEDEGSD